GMIDALQQIYVFHRPRPSSPCGLRRAAFAASQLRLASRSCEAAKAGGRDRDRTCDPYHVKVSRRERNVVKPGIFCFPSVETEPERLPNEGGFAIKLLSSGLRSRFIPWAGSARKVVPLVISLTFKLIGPARAAPALSSGGTLGLGALPRRKANTTEPRAETHPPSYLAH